MAHLKKKDLLGKLWYLGMTEQRVFNTNLLIS